MKEIADDQKRKQGEVVYWMKKYGILRRTRSDAIYKKRNPHGDPFRVKPMLIAEEFFLLGLGIGLYWEEGTKKDSGSVRLGNTDPGLIAQFINFLETVFEIDKNKLRFGLQIFSDIDKDVARGFWKNHLNISDSQFQKVVITPARSIGTYREKSKYGVLTLYFGNKKLRNILCKMIELLQTS